MQSAECGNAVFIAGQCGVHCARCNVCLVIKGVELIDENDVEIDEFGVHNLMQLMQGVQCKHQQLGVPWYGVY